MESNKLILKISKNIGKLFLVTFIGDKEDTRVEVMRLLSFGEIVCKNLIEITKPKNYSVNAPLYYFAYIEGNKMKFHNVEVVKEDVNIKYNFTEIPVDVLYRLEMFNPIGEASREEKKLIGEALREEKRAKFPPEKVGGVCDRNKVDTR